MRRVLGVFVVILVWFALFDVPSAVAICRHAPWWLAAAIGGVCLAAPFGWHLVRERKKADKKTLSGWDRLILRTVVVGILVGFGSWAVAKPDLWTALKHHWDWMFPRSNHLKADSKLLDLVPSDADSVLWVRGYESPELTEKLQKICHLHSGEHAELVGAAERNEMMLALDGSGGLDDNVPRIFEMFKSAGDFTEHDHDGQSVWTTSKWVDSGKRADALIAMLERAPADASVVAAAGPGATHHGNQRARKAHDDIESAVGWLRYDDEQTEATAEFDMPDEPAARALITEIEVEANTSPVLRCFDGAWTATHDDKRVTVRATFDMDDVPAMMACATGLSSN